MHIKIDPSDSQRVGIMYLSRATLVIIIPLNRLVQWYLETNKYCDEVFCVDSDISHKWFWYILSRSLKLTLRRLSCWILIVSTSKPLPYIYLQDRNTQKLPPCWYPDFLTHSRLRQVSSPTQYLPGVLETSSHRRRTCIHLLRPWIYFYRRTKHSEDMDCHWHNWRWKFCISALTQRKIQGSRDAFFEVNTFICLKERHYESFERMRRTY